MHSLSSSYHDAARVPVNEFQQILQSRLNDVCHVFYENNVHKKFLADVYAVIPKGKKCVIWFTNKQAWMFQIAKRPYQPNQSQPNQSQPYQVRPSHPVSFDSVRMLNVQCTDEAWHHGTGTILYGTHLVDKKRFSVENVHYFCGMKQENDGSMTRFLRFFESLKKCNMGPTLPFQFFMPIMHTSYADAFNDATSIKSYEVYSIQHRFLKRDCSEYKNLLFHLAQPQPQPQSHPQSHQRSQHQPHQPHQPQSQPTNVKLAFFPNQAHSQNPAKKPHLHTFHIKADIQNDIYYVLHALDEPITQTTMIAHIPNYKTSVMMNSIFRNIKENRNLDALEESDDEDEINDLDKCSSLVDLDKCVKMECTFNARFKRWHPVAPLES
jgi:hypothetical protein